LEEVAPKLVAVEKVMVEAKLTGMEVVKAHKDLDSKAVAEEVQMVGSAMDLHFHLLVLELGAVVVGY
jgi:hypothetical protein